MKKKKIIIIGSILCVCLFICLFQIKTTLNKCVIENDSTNLILNGKEYEYNDDLFNVLVLGVDLEGSVKVDKPIGQRGQADVIYIISIDKKTKETTVLSIPRDTMINVTHLDEDGNYVGTYFEQITLQHAIGKNEKDSCEIMAQTVSELLNRIPIHRYVALSYSSIPEMNDAIGGVDVTMDNYVDPVLMANNSLFQPGATIHLDGELAHLYLRIRDESQFDSAAERMERQKQYIAQYISKTKTVIKKNPFKIFSIYSKANKVMETNVGLMDCLALIPYIQNLNFDNVYSLTGNRTMGQYVELHLNQNDLVKTIIDVFYEAK